MNKDFSKENTIKKRRGYSSNETHKRTFRRGDKGMNNKAQTMGMMIGVFMTVIVGIILFTAVAQQTGESTQTDAISNLTLGTITNGTTYYFADYRSITGATVYGNGSVPVELSSGNYTITNNVINPTTGALSVSLEPASEYTATGWNISGTGQRTTYIADSGARSVTALIAIFFALAVLVASLIPSVRGGLADLMKR